MATAELVLTDAAAIALMDEAERALLGPAEVGAQKENRNAAKDNVNDGNVESADRVAQHKARRLAAVPEETFIAALTADDADRAPSEASVLRRAAGAVHNSSESDEWATPQDLFDELDAEFKFELDVCALDSSAKCPTYFTPETDGLNQDWKNFTCWMNPPYGDAIGEWMAKAADAAGKGATVVCLVPARVDTGWWWDYCLFGEIRFLRGRLKFGGSKTGAPFPSALVIFGEGFPPRVKWWAR
jgi:phage N-6-adenine-methyltransferase